MTEIIEKKVHGPVLHGFLLGNGKFITPEEMELMISFGTVKPTKF
ncbi:MAG: hypothetical protein PHW56_02415 [Methanosarcinaceae archaeon]|nr:hypothetical protein [Methanosarcinaceae archaeon]